MNTLEIETIKALTRRGYAYVVIHGKRMYCRDIGYEMKVQLSYLKPVEEALNFVAKYHPEVMVTHAIDYQLPPV